jgi:hypothetical protein
MLADNFTGAWLQDSSAPGDFDEHNDLDGVIGIKRDLSEGELQDWQKFHPRFYDHPAPWDRVRQQSWAISGMIKLSAAASPAAEFCIPRSDHSFSLRDIQASIIIKISEINLC